MFRSEGNEWRAHYCNDPHQALKLLDKEQFDIIFSDIRMPSMNGIELLTQVKIRHPDVARIVLSGYADRSILLKSTMVCHQYLSKPCDIGQIVATVSQVCAMQNLVRDPDLRILVSGIGNLPSLPALYLEILDEISSDDGSIHGAGKIIAKDVNMSAKILQLVNSSFFGFPRKIDSILEAVNFLGFDLIRSLVLGDKIFACFDSGPSMIADIEKIWSASIRSSHLANQLAREAGLDDAGCSATLLAGMLQDIGISILASNRPEKYSSITQNIDDEDKPRWQREQAVFGHSHAEVGAYLLALWGFPVEIVNTVNFHHRPSSAPEPDQFTALSAVYIANLLLAESAIPLAEYEIPDYDYLNSIGALDYYSEWKKSFQEGKATTESGQPK